MLVELALVEYGAKYCTPLFPMQNFDLKTGIALYVLYIHGFLAAAFKKSCNLILNAFLVIYLYTNMNNNILKIEIFLY